VNTQKLVILSDNHPSDNEDSGSAVIDQAAPQPSKKRNRPNPPLFQWHNGAFSPIIHVFDHSASGISTKFKMNQLL
jgi:hypothetical protein